MHDYWLVRLACRDHPAHLSGGLDMVNISEAVKRMVLNISHVGKRLRMGNPGTHLGCEVPLEGFANV